MKRVWVAVAAIGLAGMAWASIHFSRTRSLLPVSPAPSCPVPAGTQETKRMRDLPSPVRLALQQKFADIVDSDQAFNETDLIVQNPPHFHRFAFAWMHNGRWVVGTQRGGFVSTNPVVVLDWAAPAEKASTVEVKISTLSSLCDDAQAAFATAPVPATR